MRGAHSGVQLGVGGGSLLTGVLHELTSSG